MKWFTKDKLYFLGASLICGDPLDLLSDLKSLKRSDIDSLHFDVMDGSFVPRFGLYPEMLKTITSNTNIPVDVHLMINDPKKYIPSFIEAGANLIAIHAEAAEDILPIVQMIKKEGVLAGVALNPDTSLDVLDSVISEVDLIMIMAINPGILGQKLIPGTFQKISNVREKFKHRPEVIIEVDGGVTPESAHDMIKHGAHLLVCGTGTIYRPQEDSLENKIKELRQTIDAQIHHEL